MINATHPTRGKAQFTDRAWKLLGDSKGGWTEAAEVPEEVATKMAAAKTTRKPSNAKIITAKPPQNDVQTNAEEIDGSAGDSDTDGI